MQKTLGGDRLGSGKKIAVNLHGYERSTHNMGNLWRSTMSAGTLVPFLSKVALPGDTFDIDLDADVKTHPTIGPLFGSYKVQLDVFMAPVRLYNARLHNNAINIGRNMAAIKIPQIRLTAPLLAQPILEGTDLDNAQINPSCLLAYLGLRGIGANYDDETAPSRDFNAIPLLAYWEIYKNYYANKQEEIGMVIHTPLGALNQTVDSILANADAIVAAPATGTVFLTQNEQFTINYTGASPDLSTIQLNWVFGSGNITLAEILTNVVDNTGTTTITGTYDWARYGDRQVINWQYATRRGPTNRVPEVADFVLSNIDDMRDQILRHATPDAFLTNSYAQPPYSWLPESVDGFANIQNTQEGLGIKTYQSDLFNNWLSTEWIDGPGGITEITSIDTTAGSFSIDTLNLSRKVYNMLNRIAVSGGTYDDWLDAVYAHDRYQRCESPMYMGGLIKELVFQEVVSNSAATNTEGTGEPLGTLSGKGILAKKHKGGHVVVKVDEPSYIIGIVSITPRIDYSQGNEWDMHLKTMDDFHKPALDEIGFQELITEQMAWWDTKWDTVSNNWITNSAGKQPAWINYMTSLNKTFGNFAILNNEMFMTLNRRYEWDDSTGDILDLTTYIDPVKFNFIFAETALDAQNFWVQIAIDNTARRKMSAKVMPNL